MRPDDLCPRPGELSRLSTQPHSPAIYPTSVWQCTDPGQAEQLLAGAITGYVYQRDGHPNADLLATKCGQLHGAARVVITSSGMAALSAAVLALLRTGDHVVASRHLYGKSLTLLAGEGARLGIGCTLADTCNLDDVAAACTAATRLVVVETIANPRLQVADIAALADLAHRHRALLLVDNTFATPVLCQPLALGADLVLESVTKMMNGHSDVMLGMLAGGPQHWERVPAVVSAWGLASAPFECWLAGRGLSTLAVRMERACATAQRVAEFLAARRDLAGVDYPGLTAHPQHALARRQLHGGCGSIVTFHLPGGRAAAEAFLRGSAIPFCPSLGEVSTTLSHPESTSHRGLTAEARAGLGIHGGTIRLSVGIESADQVLAAVAAGLAAAAA
ncbi:MAG: aminotransferase class I/II-fold pyridoxal phosphate-dependent enzyme [Pirellulales bacterium]